MGVLESVKQVAKRRRLINAVVGGGLLVTLLTLAGTYWWSRSREEKPAKLPATLPREVNQQLSGYTFTRSEGGRRVFTVRAARTVAFKEGGTTVLEDVFVEVFGKTGERRDVLRTRRCDYNAQSGDLFSAGKVEIELDTPGGGEAAERRRPAVHLETSRLSFRQQGSLVVSDEPVRYRIGPASGTARGLAYATREGWLELKQDVRAELQTPALGDAPLQVQASRARYQQETAEIQLGGPVEFTQGSRRVRAGRGTVILAAENRIRRALLVESVEALDMSETSRLEGSARQVVAEFDSESGQLRLLRAEDDVVAVFKREESSSRLRADTLELNCQGAPPQPQTGMAFGKVQLTLESSPVGAGDPGSASASWPGRKELTAERARFTFRADGRSLEALDTVGEGKLVLTPTSPRTGERVITAGQLVLGFDAQTRLETLRGLAGAQVAFHPGRESPPGSVPQETSSQRLEATFDPATQILRAVDQSGDFQYREGDRRAAADRARYLHADSRLILHGSPRMWDSKTRVAAEQIAVEVQGERAEASGKVRSTHLMGAEGDREPTNVLADRMVAEQRSRIVHYEGQVRAWRGQDVLESPSLDLDLAQRRVRSGSRVRTSHLQPAARLAGAAADSGGNAKRPVTIEADRLEYFDQGRQARYLGNVLLRTETTTLRADRVNVDFTPTGNGTQAEVQRAVAEGKVRVDQPARRARGEHAEYTAAEGQIVLTGGPPSVYDAEKGFTTGRRLTFFVRDDRLLVDGGDESPTLSRHRIAE